MPLCKPHNIVKGDVFVCEAGDIIPSDGEIIEGDGDSSSKGYKVHDGDCSFSASIDADGYVTIFGIRKFVGLNAKGVYKKTFYGVRRDCELNGTFLCKPHTCAKFWLDMK